MHIIAGQSLSNFECALGNSELYDLSITFNIKLFYILKDTSLVHVSPLYVWSLTQQLCVINVQSSLNLSWWFKLFKITPL